MSPGYRQSTPDSAGAEVEQLCPQCGAPLLRIQRHVVDRLISLAWPVRRYRCSNFLCEWEGNLRYRKGGSVDLTGRGESANPES
jgi:hypothetical protein